MSAAEAAPRPASVDVEGLRIALTGTDIDVVDEIALVAAVSFIGVGLQPPTADWGLMINENRLSISVQPWAVFLPVIAIGLLTVGTNLITDGVARAAIGLDRGGKS